MDQQPVPVESLNYFPTSHSSWIPLMKATAIAAMASGTVYLGATVCQGLGAWMTGIQFTAWTDSVGMLLELCKGCAEVAIIVCGFMCLRLHPIARMSFVIALGVFAALSAATQLWSVVVIFGLRINSGLPKNYLPIYLGMMILGALGTLILPAFLIWIMTRNETKEIFRNA